MLSENLTKQTICYCLILMLLSSCYQETTVHVIPEFSMEMEEENYAAPVGVIIQNKTSGASQYSWTFEGGSPAVSNQKQPGRVIFKKAGTYTIRLEAWNDYHRETKAVEIVIDSLGVPDFEPQIQVNTFVPASVEIQNRTQGADSCEWTFEGGNPSAFLGHHPPPVQYSRPGEYPIHLRIVSGRKTHELIKTIHLLPELEPDFEIHPAWEDEDMQAPWKADLVNKTISGLSYRWTTSGGKFNHDTIAHPVVSYDQPGTYVIRMEAGNGKQIKVKTAEVNILPNTNLCMLENVRLGINTSKEIPCHFSCRRRRSFSREEINDANGSDIDFVFFGLNANFSYCRFLSPDAIQNYVFDPIFGAGKTWVVNIVKENEIRFDEKEFKEMKNDAALQKLPIQSYDSKEAYFQSDVISRLVLFETSDGRKGAILIKKFVAAGPNSYVLVDIKVQKNKT